MDHLDLLTKMRASLVLVTFSTRQAGDRDETIPEALRKTISAAQGDIRNSFEANSIVFGRHRRAIPAQMIQPLVMGAGKMLGELKGHMAELTEAQRGSYGVTIDYEPVPDPQGFMMLPGPFIKPFSDAVDRRMIEAFEDGFDAAFNVLHSRIGFFITRLDAYVAAMDDPKSGRVVMREVVFSALVSQWRLVDAANLDGISAAKEACHALEGLGGMTIDNIRKDAAVRGAALAMAHAAFSITRAYFTIDTGTDGAGDGEA